MGCRDAPGVLYPHTLCITSLKTHFEQLELSQHTYRRASGSTTGHDLEGLGSISVYTLIPNFWNKKLASLSIMYHNLQTTSQPMSQPQPMSRPFVYLGFTFFPIENKNKNGNNNCYCMLEMYVPLHRICHLMSAVL